MEDKILGAVAGVFLTLMFVAVGVVIANTSANNACLDATGAPSCAMVWAPIYPDSDF